MGFISVVVAAGGIGTRTGLDTPKQFYRLGGKTILELSVKPFDDSPIIDEIIIVTLPEYIDLCRRELKGVEKPLKLVAGSETRQKSVYNGLCAADSRCSLVVVHDAARPFVTNEEINGVIDAADCHAAVIGTKVTETVKFVDSSGIVESTPERERIWAVQTPQAIPYRLFIEAYKKADETGFSATDDTSLAELIDCPVKVVEGSGRNIKITSESDLVLAKMMLGV